MLPLTRLRYTFVPFGQQCDNSFFLCLIKPAFTGLLMCDNGCGVSVACLSGVPPPQQRLHQTSC